MFSHRHELQVQIYFGMATIGEPGTVEIESRWTATRRECGGVDAPISEARYRAPTRLHFEFKLQIILLHAVTDRAITTLCVVREA